MERVKRYIKIFSKIGIGTSLLFCLLMSLKIGLSQGILAGIIYGIGITILAAAVLIPIDFLLTKNLPSEAYNVRQNREFQVNGDFDTVFQNCVALLDGIDFIKNVTPIKDKKIISALTKTTLISFGEAITLQFIIESKNITKIYLSSSPTFKFTLLDYGKNYKNVDYINKAIVNKL